MSKFAKGKYALAISDRSGQAFPWREMVTEWNGAFVHITEYERKQPQLEPKPFVADPQGLEQARPQRFDFKHWRWWRNYCRFKFTWIFFFSGSK